MSNRLALSSSKHLTIDHLEEVRTLLGLRPPDAAFTANEAAIYTGRSTRTLKRAIDAGVGPKREKNPDISGLGATNRHTRYRKADLDAWRETLIAFATTFRKFDDLAADAPWVVEGDRITGHLLDEADVEAMQQVLGEDAVIFLRLDEALGQAWKSADVRNTYRKSFETICQQAVREAAAAAQRDALEVSTGAATEPNRPPLRP